MSRPSVESTLFRARKRLTEEYDELVSGQRCVRVQGIIAGASGGGLGARDRRRMARHLSYCQACRRHAYSAGLGDVVPAKTGVGAKIAGLLPLPFFLQKRLLGLRGPGGDGSHAGAIAHWSASASQFEPAAAGWTKAVATAATIAVAGVGAGAVTSQRNDVVRAVGPAGLSTIGGGDSTSAAPVAASPAGGRATTVAASPTRGATRTTPTRGGTRTTATTPSAKTTTSGAPASQAAGGAGASQQAAAAAKPKAQGSGDQANPLQKSIDAVTGGGAGDQSTGGSGTSNAQLPTVSVPTSTPTVPSDVTTVPTDVTKSLGGGGGGDKSAGDVGKTVGDAVGSLTGG